jgi:hypothetical protein
MLLAYLQEDAKGTQLSVFVLLITYFNKHVHQSLYYKNVIGKYVSLLLPTLIPLSRRPDDPTCRYNIFSSCDKDSTFIFMTGRLPDVNPP